MATAVLSDPINSTLLQLDFNPNDLTPQAYGFNYLGVQYVLHEPSEGDKIVLRSHHLKGANLVDGKAVLPAMERVAETESLLLSLCLKVEDGSKTGRPVPVGVIRGWSPRLVKKLYDKAVEMGGLSETTEAKEKQFEALAKELVSSSVNDDERRKWREWMVSRVESCCLTEPNKGTPDDHAKN